MAWNYHITKVFIEPTNLRIALYSLIPLEYFFKCFLLSELICASLCGTYFAGNTFSGSSFHYLEPPHVRRLFERFTQYPGLFSNGLLGILDGMACPDCFSRNFPPMFTQDECAGKCSYEKGLHQTFHIQIDI